MIRTSKIKNIKSLAWLMISCVLMLTACETEFIPEGAELEPEIVVEGYIEAGENATLPFVLLTRSVSFFQSFDPSQIDALFVHDAAVDVTVEGQEYPLTEFCVNDLPEPIRDVALALLGFEVELGEDFPNICAYVDTTGTLIGEEGKRYDLKINTGEQLITATTTIPEHVPIYGFYSLKPTEFLENDSLLELRAFVDDPLNEANFYRYFTAVNEEPFRAAIQSVSDDVFFDGQSFEFPLGKAESFIDPPEFEEYGLFALGDTARIKWATMDEAHFRFWLTLEFNRVSQGPFSSYTIVNSNVEGGVGIWGGYAVKEYEIIIE